MQKIPNRFSKDELYAVLIRMWAAGIVYLFIGFGTSIGETSGIGYFIPMIFSLSLGITVLSMLVVNPVIRMLLKTRLNETKYQRNSFSIKIVLKRVLNNIVFFIMTAFIVILVSCVYFVINSVLNALKGTIDEVFLSVEPIGFAIFYGVFYFIFTRIFYFIKNKIQLKKEI